MTTDDELKLDDGTTIKPGAMMSYQGKPGCTDARCRQINGECRGYHCADCGQPASMYGHFGKCPDPADA